MYSLAKQQFAYVSVCTDTYANCWLMSTIIVMVRIVFSCCVCGSWIFSSTVTCIGTYVGSPLNVCT